MKLQALQNATSFTWGKCLIQGSRCMGMEVVLHQANVLGVWIHLINQPAHDFGVVPHGTVLSHLNVPPLGQRLHHHEQIASPLAFILVIDPFRLAWLHGDRRVDIRMQRHRLFIQADHGVLRIVRCRREIEHILQPMEYLPGEIDPLVNTYRISGTQSAKAVAGHKQ